MLLFGMINLLLALFPWPCDIIFGMYYKKDRFIRGKNIFSWGRNLKVFGWR